MDIADAPQANSCHKFTYSDYAGNEHFHQEGFSNDDANACWNNLSDAAAEKGIHDIHAEP